PAPAANPPTVLFELPDASLARFVSEVRRYSGSAVGVRLLPVESGPGRAWVTVHCPPPGLVLRYQEPDSVAEAFAEQAPGVWARVGWEHPLPDHLAVAD